MSDSTELPSDSRPRGDAPDPSRRSEIDRSENQRSSEDQRSGSDGKAGRKSFDDSATTPFDRRDIASKLAEHMSPENRSPENRSPENGAAGAVPKPDTEVPGSERGAGENKKSGTAGIRRSGDTGQSGDTEGWDTIGLEPQNMGEARASVEATLILIAHPEGKLLGKRYSIGPNEEVRIGRSPDLSISFPEIRSISRAHAKIVHHGLRVTIEDLGSKNHTFVNDLPISTVTTLTSGDRFQVGSLHFKFLHELDVEHAYHQAIYDLGQRDGLTECLNKKKLEEELEREAYRSLRYGRPAALILFDLDQFKGINDTYGHLCGDYVLKRLTQTIRPALRPEHLFGRLGGDEFGILLPETTAKDAFAIAETLRQRIADGGFEHDGAELGVTCSFGVAALQPGMTSHRDLFRAADEALYSSKKRGRNCVTQFGQ